MARDLIVIGGSSGSIEALSKVVAALPADLAAAVFVVVHVGEHRHSLLPGILNRRGSLPAAHAVDREPIRRGRVYVAPPGLQTYLQKGRLSVRRGPVENLHRPSIDALFRTAAHYFGSRVIGVVLSGAMDDGAAGLAAVKTAGGLAIVQDPHDAQFPDMPMNALQLTDADHVVSADEIGGLLAQVVDGHESAAQSLPSEVPLETVDEATNPDEAHASRELGQPSEFTCPDCSGTLYEIKEEERVRFRCRVGHAYSEEAIVTAQTQSVERALWTALRALEERSSLLHKLSEYARRRGHASLALLYQERSQQIDDDLKQLHQLVTNGPALDPVADDSHSL